jgi:hypothetical protein
VRLVVVLAAASLACAVARPHPPLPEGLDEPAARASLARFAGALQAARFEEAHALLSARWRTAYTPGRLALDLGGAGSPAREAAGRVLAAVGGGASLDLSGGRATLPLGVGRAAVLVAEGGSWRVDALE